MGGRVDSHHHVWDLAVRDQPWTAGLPPIRRSFSFADVTADMAAAGVERTVVVQTVCVSEETPELLELARSTQGGEGPRVAGVVGWADLCSPALPERLARLRELPGGRHLVGVRHQVQEEPDAGWLCRPDVRRGLAGVGAAGLAYDLVVRPHQLPAVQETVAALGDVRFVLDHAGKPPVASRQLEPWLGFMKNLACLPNLAVKLSGLVTEADLRHWRVADLRPYAEAVLALFGPERTMWGSDWPVCLLAAPYGEVVSSSEALLAGLSAPEQAQVFGGTAAGWYGL